MTNKTTDDWDGFTGVNFLKTIHVKDENDGFVVEEVEVFTDDDGSAKPRLSLAKEDTGFLFDLNVTNSNFCKNAGIKTPREMIGKKVFFKKVLVNNPKTKKEVESLRISKIE